MSYSILSDETRQHLEQERSRLNNDRETIIQTAVEQATAAIDLALQHLNSLLGDESISNSHENQLPDLEAEMQSEVSTSQSVTKSKGKRGQQKAKPFDGKVLRPEFEELSPIDAMVQVIQQSPGRSFDAEAVIRAVYDEFDEAELPKAKRSVKITLVLGVKKGLLEKVQDHPPLFKALTEESQESDEADDTASVSKAEPDEEFADAETKDSKKASKVKAKPRATSKGKEQQSEAQAFDAQNPKRAFRGMEPLQAMINVTATDPERSFSTNDIIREVYGEFEGAEMSRAIKSVAGTLTRGMRQGFLEKTHNNPAQFKFKTSSEEARLAPEQESISA
ncbi:MAG: hypothetical protein LH660_09410 [Phormidesmis sp. CAN_BIN36]|nr:hypothetical protein [Phormidesmis sp. CAN_BIN36]